MKKLTAVLSISMLLFSCSNNLTRDKAKELIAEKNPLPERLLFFVRVYNVDGIQCTNTSDFGYPVYNKLVENNFLESLNFRDSKITENLKKYFVTEISTTNSGENPSYLNDYRNWIGQYNNKGLWGQSNWIGVEVCKIKFGEITGLKTISEDKVEAEFTYVVTDVTPLGKCIQIGTMNGANDPFISEGYINKHTAEFIKYDDGWRINSIR